MTWRLFALVLPWCTPLALLLPLSATVEGRLPDRMLDVWPDLAPGETTRETGHALDPRPNEAPPATRVAGITRPRLAVYEPAAGKKTGVAIIVLPGGGYNYVVTDKEGSEAADWLNEHGITLFVLHYRTKSEASESPPWKRPVQDGQRAVRLLRAQADALGLDPSRIGVLGFSAGGQASAVIATAFEDPHYTAVDETDELSCRPDFCLLIYPWQLVDKATNEMMPAVTITKHTPPTFLAHAHDDSATSMSSILFYSGLRLHQIPAELHVYQAGGHGYGMRPVANTMIETWTQRASDWLIQRGLSAEADSSAGRLKHAIMDGTGAGWRSLGEADFVNVNCEADTWRWQDGVAYCTGKPTGVIRSQRPFKNFELVCEWKHKQKGGNSGVFVWASPQSIDRLAAGKGRLPEGIEVQVLDLGYTDVYKTSTGKEADWFTSHGDVFPVGATKMTPFAPVAPNGTRSFPSKNLTKGLFHWNHYYVRAINGEVRLWVNGEEVSGGTDCDPAEGYLCLESEGAPVEFRNIRIRELP